MLSFPFERFRLGAISSGIFPLTVFSSPFPLSKTIGLKETMMFVLGRETLNICIPVPLPGVGFPTTVAQPVAFAKEER